MGRYRFVDPDDIVRLSLSDGDWIDVKKELNAGERNALFGKMVVGGYVPGKETTFDAAKIGIARAAAYLVGWSFTDRKGQPIHLSEAAIRSLQSDTFAEIVTALDAHETEQETARDEEKKLRNTATSLRAV